ncbi:MAG: cell division protein FtsH, partial [Pseudomonadota bacterium]
DDTAMLIDSEVRRIVEEAEARARATLSARMDGLHAVARALLDYETLSGKEVQDILDGKSIEHKADAPPRPPASRASVPPTEPDQSKGSENIKPTLQPQY